MLPASGIMRASVSCSSLYLHQTIVLSSGHDRTWSTMYCGLMLLSHFAIRDNFERVVMPPNSVTNSCPVVCRTACVCSADRLTSSM